MNTKLIITGALALFLVGGGVSLADAGQRRGGGGGGGGGSAAGRAVPRGGATVGTAVPRTGGGGPPHGGGGHYGGNHYYGPRYSGYYGYYGYPYYGYPYYGYGYYPYGLSLSFGLGYGYPYGYAYGGYGYPYGGYVATGYAVSAYGGVRITDAPPEAAVYADGYYVGIVDDFDGTFQRVNLEPGAHHIEIKPPQGGPPPVSLDVNVRPGQTITYRAY